MALPKQVEAQIKELEEIEKQLTKAAEPEEPKALEEPKAEEAQPTQAPAPEPAPKQEAKPDKPAEPSAEDVTWQQKYRTLKGMYDAEVPRLHAELKELKAQVDKLRQTPTAQETPPQKAHEPVKLVTDADVEAFGQDLIEVQRKVAREVAAEFRKELDDLKGENEKLREQLTATGSQIVEATFEQRLHRLVPDFDVVNADPKWIEWLNEIDPLLRGPRKNVAQQAFTAGDAEGVAHYVKLFKESFAPAANSEVDRELERQIQPSRSAASAPTPSPKGRVYTNADIQKMFKTAVDLGAKGRHEEARKLEAEIDAAYTEGRVTA